MSTQETRFIESADGVIATLNKPVDPELLDSCHREYHIRTLKTKTHYVTFPKEELCKWISDTESATKVDSFRIYMGVYPDSYLDEIGKPEWKNKMTVFITPFYKGAHSTISSNKEDEDGERVDPYNMGEIYP